jgi:hypothetical protein
MTDQSQQYVARAERCKRLAETTDDTPLKEQFFHLSRSFLEYARHLEARDHSEQGRGQARIP